MRSPLKRNIGVANEGKRRILISISKEKEGSAKGPESEVSPYSL